MWRSIVFGAGIAVATYEFAFRCLTRMAMDLGVLFAIAVLFFIIANVAEVARPAAITLGVVFTVIAASSVMVAWQRRVLLGEDIAGLGSLRVGRRELVHIFLIGGMCLVLILVRLVTDAAVGFLTRDWWLRSAAVVIVSTLIAARLILVLPLCSVDEKGG